MRINIIAIGKIKEKYFADAVEEFSRRISRFVDFSVVEVMEAPPTKSVAEKQDIEGKALLQKAKGYVVVMDGRGKTMSSEELSELISSKCAAGQSEFSLLIGGSHGHSEFVLKSADVILSFGRNTFPHQLFRVMLTEQIYRAISIINGLPYHK